MKTIIYSFSVSILAFVFFLNQNAYSKDKNAKQSAKEPIPVYVGPNVELKSTVTPISEADVKELSKQLDLNGSQAANEISAIAEKADVCPRDGENPGIGGSNIESDIKNSISKFLNPANATKLQTSLDENLKKYVENKDKCLKAQPKATKGCLTNSSQDLQMAMGMGQQLFASGASAVNDSCGKSSKLFDIMNLGLNAYLLSCELKKSTCSKLCGQSLSGIEEMKKAVSSFKCEPKPGATPQDSSIPDVPCETFRKEFVKIVSPELKSDNECKSVASVKNICTKNYAVIMMGGMQAIGAITSAFKKSSGCDQASSTGGAPPVATNPSDVDCSKAENASNEKCICLANPRMAGCNNSLSAMSDNNSRIPTSTSGAAAATNGTQSGLTSGDLGSGSPSTLAAGDGKSADSSGSGPRGGGSGGLGFGGGSGGGGSVGDQAKAAGKSGLDTNVLSGEGGGSGGSFGGGSAALEQALEKEKADLSDPEKVAAAAWAQQVSPESGKSNFDKIKDRYNANRRTLMSK